MDPIHQRFTFKAERCVLCGSWDLSRDHVPPKSLNNKGVYKIYTYPPSSSSQTAMNGVEFRTICKKCNNETIRNLEQETLAPICEIIRRYLKFGVTYNINSNNIEISCNSKKLSKLIVAKILASAIVHYNSIIEEGFKKEKSYWRKLWEFYHEIENNDLVFDIWIHDSFHINIFPLISIILDIDIYREPLLASVLSFYPVGFMVFEQQNKNKNNLSKLDYKSENQMLILNKFDSKTKYFPLDHLPENGVILTDDSSNIYARKIKDRFFP